MTNPKYKSGDRVEFVQYGIVRKTGTIIEPVAYKHVNGWWTKWDSESKPTWFDEHNENFRLVKN
jgi:hypothetical protein